MVTFSGGRVHAIAVLSRVVFVPDRFFKVCITVLCVRWQEPEALLRGDTGGVLPDSIQCDVCLVLGYQHCLCVCNTWGK